MNRLSQSFMKSWVSLGPRFFPFADVATPDLPLSRLLRLSLFQVSVGMALVLLVGTLNRVMIVELDVPASIVAIMLALPLLFAPFRALIGFKSDHHRCALGWRRVPFIWRGSLAQFGGFAIMPFALLVLAGRGEAGYAPIWIGQVSAGISFLLVGAGVHTVQTAGLALATDLTPQKSHPKVVGLMYVMLLLGMIASSIIFGMALEDFTNGRLIQVIQTVAVVTLLLNCIAMWKQETRHSSQTSQGLVADPSFRDDWLRFCAGDNALRRLTIIGLGTMAFGMADVILEPYGGHILGLSVSATTKLTALLAIGGLLGFGYASHVTSKGAEAHQVARNGALIGLPAFAFVIVSAPLDFVGLFLLGNFLIGFGGALLAHGTLTATMNRAPSDQAGLALGAWGAVQATAAGVGMAASGVLRDLFDAISLPPLLPGINSVANGYLSVYSLEMAMLVATVLLLMPLIRAESDNRQPSAASLISPGEGSKRHA